MLNTYGGDGWALMTAYRSGPHFEGSPGCNRGHYYLATSRVVPRIGSPLSRRHCLTVGPDAPGIRRRMADSGFSQRIAPVAPLLVSFGSRSAHTCRVGDNLGKSRCKHRHGAIFRLGLMQTPWCVARESNVASLASHGSRRVRAEAGQEVGCQIGMQCRILWPRINRCLRTLALHERTSSFSVWRSASSAQCVLSGRRAPPGC